MVDSVLSFFGAERRAATCSICGQSARAGAKLCAQCKAALKRARHDPVSQLEPLPRKSHSAPDPGRRTSHHRPDIAAGIEPPVAHSHSRAQRGRRLPSLLVASGVAVAVLGVAATIVRHDAGLMLPMPMVTVPVAPPAPAVSAIPAAADVAAPQAGAVAAAPAPLELRAPAPLTSPKVAPMAGLPKSAAPAPAAADPLTAFGPTAEPAAPAPVAAPASPPREAPAPDRWQQMTDAIARCGRGDDFIGRVVCEQRARLAACDGYWGLAPQCPSGIPNDHGQ